MSQRKFLFEYRFRREMYGFDVPAESAEEARERVEAMGIARYCGEIHATIPVPAGGLILWFLDWLRRPQ